MSAARRRDVLAMSAAAAHADAERGILDRDAALRYSTSRRSHARWREEGPPQVREFISYLMASTDPYRVEAMIRASTKQRALMKLSDADLIARYRELLVLEPQVEADDRIVDLTPGAGWLQRAAASERDSAIDAEKAACEREFAARGITEAEVMGR